MSASNVVPVHVRFPTEYIKGIDGWRRQQPEPPSRPEAIRRLVLAALQDAEQQKERA